MKMIRAIIRPEKELDLLKQLEDEGFYAMTKVPVLGCGQQQGIQVGAVSYHELAKLMLILVVEDKDYDKAIGVIEEGGHTGHPGDGKIFVQQIQKVYTVRTGEERL